MVPVVLHHLRPTTLLYLKLLSGADVPLLRILLKDILELLPVLDLHKLIEAYEKVLCGKIYLLFPLSELVHQKYSLTQQLLDATSMT